MGNGIVFTLRRDLFLEERWKPLLWPLGLPRPLGQRGLSDGLFQVRLGCLSAVSLVFTATATPASSLPSLPTAALNGFPGIFLTDWPGGAEALLCVAASKPSAPTPGLTLWSDCTCPSLLHQGMFLLEYCCLYLFRVVICG